MSDAKVALITGVGPGLGASLAHRFVRGGGKAAALTGDMSEPGQVQSLVAHVIVDGIISEAGATSPNEPELDPDAMAEAYWQLAHQSPSACSLEIDLRSYREKFFE